MKSKTTSDEKSAASPTTSEVEGSVYAGIQFNFFFITIDLGVQGNVKFTMNGEQTPAKLVENGLREMINWKLAKDFLPNLQKAKQQIEESYRERRSNIHKELYEMYQKILKGEWSYAADYHMIWETPRENIEDEMKYFASDINSAMSDLDSKSKADKNDLIDWTKVNRLMGLVKTAPSRDKALEFFSMLRDELIQNQLPESLRRIRSEIDSCAPHANNANVGFEGNIQFIAGGSAKISEKAAISGKATQTTAIKDDVNSTSWDFNTHTATEVSAGVSVGDYQFTVGGKFEPDFASRKKMEIKVGGEIGLKSAEEPPEQTAQTFLESLKNTFQTVRSSRSPAGTIKNIAKSGLNSLRSNNKEYFSASSAQGRSKPKASGESKAGLEFEVKFEHSNGVMTFKGLKVTLKQENAVSVGSAMGASAMPVKGTASAGTAVSVSFGV